MRYTLLLDLNIVNTDCVSHLQAHLYVVKEDGEPALRQWALSLLIEDRMDQLPSYNQWLGQLKDKVRRIVTDASSTCADSDRFRSQVNDRS